MGVLIAQANFADRNTLYIVHVAHVCRTLSTSRLLRPGAGYPRSEGSGAKFEVYLGRATAARAIQAELEDIQTHHVTALSVSL